MSGQSANSNSLMSSISNMTGGGNSSNYFNQNVANNDSLQDLYGRAAKFQKNNQPDLNSTAKQVGQYINGVNQQATPAWQQQMRGGAYQGTDVNDLIGSLGQSMQQPTAQASDQLITSLNNSLNREFTPSGPTNTQRIYNQIMGGEGNTYADAMKGQYLSDANLAQQNMLSNLDARTAASGMTGSSREGIAQGLGLQGINRNLQEQLARTGYETFDKDLGNKLDIARQADTNNLTREGMYLDDTARAQGLGFNELQNLRGQQFGNLQGAQGMYGNLVGGQQDTMSQGLGNATNMQNLGMGSFAPLAQQWSGIQNLADVIGGPTILNSGSGYSSNWMSGSNNSASSAKSKSGGGGI